MKSRQVAGLIALILVVLGLGVLTWFTYGFGGRNEIAAAVPAPAEEAKPAATAEAPAAPSGTTPGVVARAESAVDANKDESRIGGAGDTGSAPAPSASTEAPAASANATPESAPTASEAAPTEAPAAPAEVARVEPEATTPAAPEGEVGMSVTGRKTPAAEGSNIPTFDVVRVEPSGDTAIAGLSAPGAKVELMDGNNVIANAEANTRGEWTIILDKPLTPGTHDLAIRATTPDGKEQYLSEQRVAVAVPDKGSRDVLAVVNEPGAPSRVLDKPAEGASVAAAQPAPMADRFTNAEPGITPGVSVDAVEADPDGGVYVAGAAKTQDSVRVYLNGELLGETKPGPEGKWLLEGTRKLEPGEYTVRADQISKSGDVIVRAEVPFERDAEMAALSPVAEAGGTAGGEMSGNMPEPTTVIIRRGDNLWKISRRWYGRGMRYSTIYEANTDQIRDPHWIYPGQVFVMPAGDTKWKTE